MRTHHGRSLVLAALMALGACAPGPEAADPTIPLRRGRATRAPRRRSGTSYSGDLAVQVRRWGVSGLVHAKAAKQTGQVCKVVARIE